MLTGNYSPQQELSTIRISAESFRFSVLHYARTLKTTINLPFPLIVPYVAVLTMSYRTLYHTACILGTIPRLLLVQHSLCAIVPAIPEAEIPYMLYPNVCATLQYPCVSDTPLTFLLIFLFNCLFCRIRSHTYRITLVCLYVNPFFCRICIVHNAYGISA